MIAHALRPATEADLPRLLEIHEGAFRLLTETRYVWDPKLQRTLVQDSLSKSQVVLVAGEVVGQVMLEDRGDSLFLARIMLDPRLHGQGLGGQLVEAVIARAAVAGQAVTLSVWETNRAQSLYKRLGFRVTHQEDFRLKLRRDP